jgi:excisionase family DNA binding protein
MHIIKPTSGVNSLAYSTTQVSILLNVSRSMVFKLIRQGELKTFKVGTRTLIPVSEIDEFIKSGGSKQNA